MANRNRTRDIDKKWASIFTDYDVLTKIENNGYFKITAEEIRNYKEARLMTKFDYINSLPDLFFDNDLSILPTRRGEYIIGNFDAYQTISNHNSEFRSDRTSLVFPEWVETLDYRNISSEAIMLNASYISGMIHDLFNADGVFQTLSGRMSSDSFNFNINDTVNSSFYHEISVTNSQIEIDAGFETEDSLILVEAKNNTTDSFLIRQLYYPFRTWSQKVRKPVIPVYLQYINGTYNFSVFEFTDPLNYNSLQLIERKNYMISDEILTTEDILSAVQEVTVRELINPTEVPFPQADDLNKIIELMDTLYVSEDGFLTLEEMTLKNNFTMRQAQYYSRAALYLKLVTIDNDKIRLNFRGENMMHSGGRERKIILIRNIFSHKPFNTVMKHRLSIRRPLTTRETFDIVKENDLLSIYEYSDNTIYRRSQTINAWIRIVLEMSNEY